jgi:Ca2+-binding RTX toxin-like protein
MLTLAAIAVLVVASVAESKTVNCNPNKVCKGTEGNDWIFGSTGSDNIRPMGGDDYVFANSGSDQVAHSYGDDRIFGGCGSDTVRGGFGFDRIYANMPQSWINMPVTWNPSQPPFTCAHITAHPNNPPTQDQINHITALAEAVGDDVDDQAGDLVDCAWLGSRGDEGPDEGFGQPRDAAVPDTVVDCSNRDDQ